LFIRRRVSIKNLDDLVVDVKKLIDNGWSKTDALDASIQDFMMSKGTFDFEGETEEKYWDSYEKFEKPLSDFVKSKLD